jgi:hypothetical protein
MLHVIGVDPGQEGAAVLLAPDGRTVEAVWAWTYRDRKAPVFEVRQELPGLGVTELEVRFLHQLVMASTLPVLRKTGPYLLVGEELFVWEGHDCGFDTLAEVTGEVLGPLRSSAAGSARVLARKWRPVVLPRGWGRSSADAERAAHTVCRATMLGLDAWLGQRELEGRPHPSWPHVLEAALMARWGWLQQRGPAQRPLLAARGGRR